MASHGLRVHSEAFTAYVYSTHLKDVLETLGLTGKDLNRSGSYDELWVSTNLFHIHHTAQRGQCFRYDPRLGALRIATLLVMDYCSHSSLLLLKPLAWCTSMTKDGEGALLL
jgi:hypothetical protein